MIGSFPEIATGIGAVTLSRPALGTTAAATHPLSTKSGVGQLGENDMTAAVLGVPQGVWNIGWHVRTGSMGHACMSQFGLFGAAEPPNANGNACKRPGRKIAAAF